MNYTFSMCEYFYSMSRDQYDMYIKSRNDLNEVAGYSECFDVLSHSSAKIQEFNLLHFKTNSAAIATIVFQALAVEAYINFYGVIKLGDNMFNSHYERISIADKIVILSKVATGRDFPKGNNIFNLIKKLF